MSTFDFRTLCVTSLVGTGLFLYSQHVPAEVMTPHELAERLLSEDPVEVQRAQAILEIRRKEVFERLITAIRSSDHEVVRGGAQDLAIIVSPWIRAKVASERSWGISIFDRPRRPVDRLSSLPEADICRRVIVEALDRLIDDYQANPTDRYQWVGSILELIDTLSELADDKVIDWAAGKVASIKHRQIANSLMVVIDSYGGIPPSLLPYLSLVICGTMSREESARYQIEQEAFLREALLRTLGSWHRIRTMNPDERIKYAITWWRALAFPRMQKYPSFHGLNIPLGQPLEQLIRIGPSALPQLRAQKDLETSINAKALWEYVLAAISGEEDPVLVRALFAGTNAQREVACEIVAASGSKQWFEELSDLQIRVGFEGGTASRALISCHGRDAIPALEEALKFNPNNYTAKFGLEKLVALRDQETDAD